MSIWPEITAPPQYPDLPGWEDPKLPDFRLIFRVARNCGYSIGLHGSMKRDCDLIAAPWTEDATDAISLIKELCNALDARLVGDIGYKPHGRTAFNLQIHGWYKLIDLSILPRDLPPPQTKQLDKEL